MALFLIVGLVATSGAVSIRKAEAATAPTWTNSVAASQVISLLDVNGTLYAGTQNNSNDVYTYSNGAWTQMSGSPSDVSSMLDVNGTLYAGSIVGLNGVYAYSNGAWTLMSGSPSSVYSLLDVNGTLYAGTQNGSNDVYAYSNGTWTQMSGSPSNVNTLLNVNGTLYAGTSNGTNDVYVYSNGTWTPMSGSPSYVHSLLEVNGMLYAGTQNGTNDVYAYSNGAWTQMSGSPSNVNTLLNVNGTLYAGTYYGVYTYSNGAWTPMSGSPSSVNTLLDVNGALYAGTSNGNNDVYAYSNGAWTNVGMVVPIKMTSLLDMNGTLYAGTYYGVYTYSNGAWTPMSGSPVDVNILLVVNGTLYAGTSNGSHDVYAYSNGAWTPVSGSPSYVTTLLDVNGTLYAGTRNESNAVYAYSNGTWTPMRRSPNSVQTLLDVSGTLYAGTSFGGVYAYNNGAWTSMSGSPSSVNTLLDVNGTLYAGNTRMGNGGNVYSYSNGAWTQMSGFTGSVYSLVDINGTLYAGTYYGVYTYSNGAWAPVSGSPSYVSSLSYVSGTLYAGARNGIASILFAPESPTNVQAGSTSSTTTTLSWTAVPGATSYNVYENGCSTPIAMGIVSAGYAVTGLHPGTQYVFSVSAVNAAGESALSAPVTVNTANIGSVQLTPNNTDVLSGETITVSGVVYDVYGAPVSSATVDLSSQSGTFNGSSTLSVMADVYGAFSTTWTAPTVTAQTSTTVTASVYGANVTPTTLSFTIASPPSITTTTLAGVTLGSAYSQTLASTGGFAPDVWSVFSGSLPPGLTLNASTGLISGTPTSVGSSSFTVRVTDRDGHAATQALSITVVGAVQVPSIPVAVASVPVNAAPFSTVVQNDIGLTGTAPVSTTVQGSTVTLDSSSHGSITMTTQDLSTIGPLTSNLPMTAAATTAFGIQYNGVGFPVTVTVANPSITVGSSVDTWVDGKLVQVPAIVKNGTVTLQVTSDTNLVVVTPLPVQLYPFQREIVWNGQSYEYNAMVRTDPDTNVRTTYMPIYYVMQVLKTMGLQSTWNGHEWSLTTSASVATTTGLSQKGNMTISLNGQTSEKVPGVVGRDPLHGNQTTYMPVWYVMQILKQAGISSDWTGSLWAMHPAQ